ncbi:hypothetical protein SAMN04488139_1307 [Pseudidiomarina donghaiensis]|nr:hypothetical protein SAMN04488139_1307 [Pseudidiomarina donghaiensis]
MSNISNLEDYRTSTPSIKNSKVTNPRKYKDVNRTGKFGGVFV